MPIYEYECEDCGHEFEIMQKMSDNKLTVCPECNKSTLRKLISATAFRLKGKGWYETDFKGDGKKNLSSSDSSTESGADASSKSAGDKQDTPKDSGKAVKAKKESTASGKKEGQSSVSKPTPTTKK